MKAGSGEAVKRLQERLSKLGYRPGNADGAYGAQTASAVMAFEKHEGLGRDGVAGPAWLTPARERRARARIEVDLDRQIAFVVSRQGRGDHPQRVHGLGPDVRRPGHGTAVAYTPTGRFTVYRKEDGIVEAPLGSLQAALLRRGLGRPRAASVPGYPASHGCVRTSDNDQDFVSRTLSKGSTVIIYGTSRGEPKEGQPGF